MNDIRQTPEYANYLKLLGWETAELRSTEQSPSEAPRLRSGRRRKKIRKGQIFIKKFPLLGSIIKVQRIPPPIPYEEIKKIAKENRTFQILIDQENPAINKPLMGNSFGMRQLTINNFKKYGYKINKASYFPTKTVHIDLTKSEKEIFDSFSEAKRRAVRKAEKNGIIIKEVKDFEEFLWLKKRSLWEKPVVPIATGKEVKNLYLAFFPKNAKILIASQVSSHHLEKPVAGIFMLHSSKVAYYWLAAATNLGKKLFAPTLLVWEALKLAKKINCQIFDFEGVYDERFPLKSWLGFTKFKEGFGGKEVLYPPSLIKNTLLFS